MTTNRALRSKLSFGGFAPASRSQSGESLKISVLANTILSLAALLALTSCATNDVSTTGAESDTGVAQTLTSESGKDPAGDGQTSGGGLASLTCAVLDFATVFSFSSCESNETSIPFPDTDSGVAGAPANDSSLTSTEEGHTTEATVETENSSSGKIGQRLVNGGVTLTATKAEIVESIPMNRSGYETGTEYAKITHEKPEKGGKFLRVDTLVENTSSVSMDLTCGWPIDTKIIDSQKREFDKIDDLYELENNPICNDGLQPGFKATMSFVYLLPEDATATGMTFRDSFDESESGKTTITFDQPLK